MILNKENTFTEQNRFLVYSDQLNATLKQILNTAEEMISRSAIQTFEDEGESITATDTSYLASLTVDGKAVQDGTPTPSEPVDIQVVGPVNGTFGISVNETVTTIDLQGNVLASLPDGTKDVLTVDSVGHCVLEKHTGNITIDGSTRKFTQMATNSAYYEFYGLQIVNWPGGILSTNTNNLSNMASNTTDNRIATTGAYANKALYWRVPIESVNSLGLTTVTAMNEFLASNNASLYFALLEPTTTDLGYIDMPAISGGSTISIMAQVTPTIAAKWWTKNQSDVAAAFGAVSSDLAALQGEISALDARVTALEGSNAKSLVLEKLETSKEVQSEDTAADEQEEMNLDDAE